MGKTSSALNLGAALNIEGKRVLLIDDDPQGNLTATLGYTPAEQSRTLSNLLLAAIDYPEGGYALKNGQKRPDMVVSGRDSMNAEIKININKQQKTLEKFAFMVYAKKTELYADSDHEVRAWKKS